MDRSPSLWRNREFLKLWIGQTISLFGSQITELALPLTAIGLLEATPLQMGMLGAVRFAPYLLVGLFAGVWVDRLRRRPILIVSDLGRAILLLSIPLAALLNLLTLELLYVVAFLVGILAVFFDVGYTSYLPTVVKSDKLVEGNSKLQTTSSMADIGGPGLGGLLVQALTAPIAIAIDALSFLVSAASLGMIRTPEPDPTPLQGRADVWSEIMAGLRAVFSNPTLRGLAACGATANLFIDINVAVYLLYLTRDLGLEPSALGIIVGLPAAGGLIGALIAGGVARWIGVGPAIIAAQVVAGLCALIIPFVQGAVMDMVVALTLTQTLWSCAVLVYVINSVSLRQVIAPNHLLGRVNATMRFITWGVGPIGFLVGGALGELIGLRATLLVAGFGVLLGAAWLILSPLLSFRKIDLSVTEPG